MNNPNNAQRLAIESDHPRILCLAGAGSGKTATLCARIARLVRDGADPRRMAVVTFTNSAADEMTRRLKPISPGYIGTIHGLALRVLTAHADEAGFPHRITVLDEQQADQLLESVKRGMNYRGTKAALDGALNRIPNTLNSHGTSMPDLTARAFLARLKRHGLVTFDTLLWQAARVAHLCRDYDHLAIDEAQDCTDDDWAIFDALPAGKKIAIGDFDQKIMSFRGSSNRIDDMARGDVWHSIVLEENYRSDREICAAADRLIEHNTFRVAKRTIPVSRFRGSVETKEFATEDEERRCVVVDISNEPDQSETAVLCRTNAQVDRWKDWLNGAGIEVQTRKPVELPPDWRKAKAILSYIGDPLNDFLCHQWVAISQDAAAAERLRLACAAAGKSMDAGSYHLGAVGLDGNRLGEILGRSLTPASRERIERVRATLPVGHTISELLLALAELDNQSVEEGRGVAVLTCHSAKGREWDSVYLPGFTDEITPGRKTGPDLEEERRLAYVAITRARNSVLITSARKTRNPFTGAEQESRPSRFVAEMMAGQEVGA